jgi:SAM-dependent methyltransferase
LLWAALNDLFQRLVTFDKLQQRRDLARHLAQAGLSRGAKVLDFGCGTGLFARVFLRRGLEYWGYDIDPRLLQYARRLYPRARFTSSREQLKAQAPFDLILANCCFHHIDEQTLTQELKGLAGLLAPNGVFLLLDLFEEGPGKSGLRRLFLSMERGAFIRTIPEIHRLLEASFDIEASVIQPCPLLPGSCKFNPVASNLLVVRCRKKA